MEPQRKPNWLKTKLPSGDNYRKVKGVVNKHHLNTICASGKCPNMGECWNNGTATFMILGEVCTRSCKFCATQSGKPLALDNDEPANIAESIKLMELKHAVITSVDRDDLQDLGAEHWAKTITTLKSECPEVTMEVLIPDFQGIEKLVQVVIDSGPNVISHNLETVKRLTPQTRSKADYETSLKVIKQIADSSCIAKSGIMVGLGETDEEVYLLMDDLRKVGCEILTIGQYLQPSAKHLEVVEYISPKTFLQYRKAGLEKGFRIVESAPLVRSSYHATI
jgi:lipoic acid synthetase